MEQWPKKKSAKKKKKFKRLEKAERKRFERIIQRCSDEIPVIILARLFDVSRNTVVRAQKAHGKSLSTKEGQALMRKWHSFTRRPHLPELSEADEIRAWKILRDLRLKRAGKFLEKEGKTTRELLN